MERGHSNGYKEVAMGGDAETVMDVGREFEVIRRISYAHF